MVVSNGSLLLKGIEEETWNEMAAEILTSLGDREAGQFHELVNGKGPRAHELAVESSGSLCGECLEVAISLVSLV